MVVGRQAADQEGGNAHGEQGDHQRGLAAHAIAEMTEYQGAERAGDEGDGEGQQAGQQRDGRIGGVSEEHLREIIRSGGAVCVKVVELDGSADHGCCDHGFDRIADHRLRFASGRFDCTH